MPPTAEQLPDPEGETSPTQRIAFVRRRTEAVFGASLDAMLGALEDLDKTATALVALSDTLSPEAMARLRSFQPTFQSLGAQVRDRSERCRATVRSLERLMGDARHRLEDLRTLARTATLVSLNALVVSRSLRSDGGTIDGLAQSMRSVLGEVGGLVSELATGIAAGRAELSQVELGAAALADLARAEALPAIADFAALVQARSRDDRVARSARLVSKRFAALQDRVGHVILHLQVGDSFRQRLEHVEAILALAERTATPGALHALAAAQIRAALEDLGRSSQGAIRQLWALGRTAADIPRAGAIDSLRSQGREGLGALISASARIEAIIGRLTEASDDLTIASRGLTRNLADAGQNAGEAAEFERRMTVLGLNAILLASRLGPEGRAMEEVAQQQRDIARSIIDVMARLRRDLEGVAAASRELDAAEEEGMAEGLAEAKSAAGEVMALSRRVRGHLSAMDSAQKPDEIAELVEQAREEIEGFASVAMGLGEVATALDRSGGARGIGEEMQTLLDAARALYSMQDERAVHDRLFPRIEGFVGGDTPAAVDLDDVLFA